VKDGCHVSDVDMDKLQQTLMADDCYIPWHDRMISSVTTNADCSAEVVRNGIERGDENCWIGADGDTITYTLS
jgi:hypothetical protein